MINASCSEEGQKYSVQIVSVTKMSSDPYCTYNFISATSACVPGDYLVAICDKYKVGDVISIEIAKGSQTKTCP